jgi:molybdate transport system substrate-binding protein
MVRVLLLVVFSGLGSFAISSDARPFTLDTMYQSESCRGAARCTPTGKHRIQQGNSYRANMQFAPTPSNVGANRVFALPHNVNFKPTNQNSNLTTTQFKTQNTLLIFAASSLTESFSALGRAYSTKTGVAVRFQFAGSQILRSQLENGAQADLFASASADVMQPLENKLVLPSQVFAKNRLVVIVPKRGRGLVKRLSDLSKAGVKLIFAQDTVPVGTYTRQMLLNLEATGNYGQNFAARVQGNVVSRETNVRQVALKIRLGEADAGVVYSTDVTPDLKQNIIEIAIPSRQNVVAAYPIALLKQSNNPKLAIDFMDYVLSPSGQGILQQWGFLKP